jgi:hypothetical protein
MLKIVNNSVMRFAMCDAVAFEPFRRLVEGPLKAEHLAPLEIFVRTVVLHDQMRMVPDDKWYLPQEPDTEGIYDLPNNTWYTVEMSPPDVSRFGLFEDYPSCGVSHVAPISGHLTDDYKKLTILTLGARFSGMWDASSHLYSDPVLARLTTDAEKYPAALFDQLDASWQRYARDLNEEGIDLRVPPMLGIVLTRCARREAIPAVLVDLRNEWQSAREKVWGLLDSLRNAQTLDDAMDIHRNLSEASKLFAPEPTDHDSRPVRVLWEIIAAATAGAGISALSGGKLVVGAITGAMAHVPRSVPALLHEFGPAVFGHGAFDLARRVRREASKIELAALPRLLSDVEKKGLGFR